MSRPWRGWLLGWLLLLGGCGTLPFTPPVLTPLPPSSPSAVAALDWNATGDGLMIRQSALFELAGRKFPMAGLLRVEPGAAAARLVGLNDMGVKLFDLGITPDGVEEHFLLPQLSRFPGLAGAVATSVRRIFLQPRPRPDDNLTLAGDRYALRRHEPAGEVSFLFGGDPPQLLEKRLEGEAQQWRVRYFDYAVQGEDSWPRGIVLDDDLAGYRLILWLESVKRTHE